MIFRFIVLSVALLLSGVIFAQPGKKEQQQFELALELYKTQQYSEAVNEIEKLLKKNPKYTDALLLLADVYRETKMPEKEIEVLENTLQYLQYPLVFYRVAIASFSLAEYEKALGYFEKYLATQGVSSERKSEVERKIENCRFSIDAVNHPVEFHPVRLPDEINTTADEYWPSVSLDGLKLIFTRLQKPSGGLPNEDFFVSVFDSAGWGSAAPIIEINTHENEGAQALSPDGRWLFFTACNRANGLGSCDIYYSGFDGKNWSTPKNAGSNLNSSAWEAQPSVSSDNRFLYFSSNRAGGKGKKDIWRAKIIETGIQNLSFEKPENLGNLVNSTGDEISPFIHANNRNLYFASDYHTGLGGLDLFQVEIIRDGTLSNFRNLGYPINTAKDEQGLNIGFDGKTAWFASPREPKSGLDIYTFVIPEAFRPEPVTFVKAKITNAETGEAVQASAELYGLDGGEDSIRFEKADVNGEIILCLPLTANCAFHVSEPGFLFFSKSFLFKDVSHAEDPILIDIKLNPVKLGAEMNLYNIYFETDSFKILPDSEPELEKLTLFLKNNPLLIIEIQGHTDNTGRPERNMALSELRAKSVFDYSVSQGITETRLKFKGFGETQAVATNETEQGRMLNRRTTIKILEK